jgi:CRP-like cAMP-binding protein
VGGAREALRRAWGGVIVAGPATNGLLELLPPEDRRRILSRGDRVMLGHEVLHRPDARMRHVYFPLRGLLTLMAEFEDGRAVEVATVGPEGMAGLPLVLGAMTTRYSTVSQLAGESLVLTVDVLREEIERCAALRNVLGLYSMAFIALLAQTGACSATHDMRHRLARLLLTCHDAARNDNFLITQEFLAGMLGVQRPGVSLIAEALRREGTITYRRGMVQVVDRQALESASCECYGAIRGEYRRLLS